MAYVDPIDPTTPGDGSDASLGDDRIRELKRALIERLATFFSNVDGDPLDSYIGRIVRGHDQADDEVPAVLTQGSLYQNPHDGRLYIGNSANEPQPVTSESALGISQGLAADIPNPPESVDFDLYWATDEEILYVNENNVWVAINGLRTRVVRLNGFDRMTPEAVDSPVWIDGSFYLNDPVPAQGFFYFGLRLPRPCRITRIRMWSRSEQTAGTNGRIRTALTHIGRGSLLSADVGSGTPTDIILIDNQSGDGTWKLTESVELDLTLTDEDLYAARVELETFASSQTDDAKLGYVEIEYEELNG